MSWFARKNDCTEKTLRHALESEPPDQVSERILACVYEKIRYLVLTNQGQVTDFEEVFDDVFVVVWQLISQRKFQPESTIVPYVISIARHKWLDELRRRGRMPLDLEPELPLGRLVQDVFEELEKDEQVRARHQILHRCLDLLAEPCRSILKLRFFNELSWDQVAKTLEKDKDVVESTATRCKKRLRELFEKQWNPNL